MAPTETAREKRKMKNWNHKALQVAVEGRRKAFGLKGGASGGAVKVGGVSDVMHCREVRLGAARWNGGSQATTKCRGEVRAW